MPRTNSSGGLPRLPARRTVTVVTATSRRLGGPLARRLTALVAITLVATIAPPSFAAESSLAGDLVTYTGAPMESHQVFFELRPKGFARTHLIVSTGSTTGLVPGPGCGAMPGDPLVPNRVLACPVSGSHLRLQATLGNANDYLEAEPELTAQVNAGPGDDTVIAHGDLTGGDGRDALHALYAFDHHAHSLDGGPGDDAVFGIAGREFLNPGPGTDVVFVTSERFRDDVRDVITARDGDSDDIHCDFADRSDRLLLDGLDLPLSRSGRCVGLARSSRARAIPVEIESPPFVPEDCCSGTWATVACPLDMTGACVGSATVRVGGRAVGSARFRVPPGRRRTVRISGAEFSDPDCERSVPVSATARTRLRNAVLLATRRLRIEPCYSNHG